MIIHMQTMSMKVRWALVFDVVYDYYCGNAL